MSLKTFHTPKRQLLGPCLLFLAVLALTQYLAYQQYILTRNREKKVLSNELSNVRDRFKNILETSINKANTISILYNEFNSVQEFDAVIKRIVETNMGIGMIQLVHNKKVTHVYPIEGNENLLGVNTEATTLQKVEFQKAIARKGIYFAGPRKLMHGGYAIVAKAPIYKDGKLKAFCLLLTNLSTLKQVLRTTDDKKSLFYYVLAKKDVSGTYQNFKLTDNLPGKDKLMETVKIPEGDWVLQVSYSENFEPSKSYYVISGFGIFLSLLSGWALYRRNMEKTRLQEGVREKTFMLNERIKELSVIYHVNSFLVDKKLSVEEILARVAEVLPGGLQFPEKAGAKVSLGAKEFLSEKYQESKYCHSVEFELLDGQQGSVEICYADNMVSGSSDLFLPEEKNLLKNIALKIRMHLNRIQQEKIIEDSQKLFQGAFEMSSVGMGIVSPQNTWIKVNKALCQMWGYSKEELMDTSFEKVNHPDDWEATQDFYRQVLEGKSNFYSLEKRYIHKNGSLLWGNLSVAVIRDEYDAILYSVIHIEDITDKKKYYDELKKSEANLSSIFNATEVAYLLTDKELNVVAFNRHFNEFFAERTGQGLQAEKNLMSQLGKVVPEAQSRLKQMLQKAINENISVEYEDKGVDFDNPDAQKYYQFLISPVVDGKKVIGASLAVINITVRKNLELENQKIIADLSQRNRDLEQFSYILSHNIRIPISNLLGLISMLDHEISADDMAFIMESFKESVTALDNVVADVNHILSLRKNILEAKSDVNLKSVLLDVRSELRDSIAKSEAIINFDFSQAENIYSISRYLHSIFLNLISNSLRFTSPDRNPEITIWTEKYAGNILINFQDNGAGIDLDKYGNKIFGLYKKFDLERAGKGMGLFLTKAQVTALHGTIVVESEPDKGTRFTISIPLPKTKPA